MLDGEYEMKDICIGVLVILGKNGIEKIVFLELNDVEKVYMKESVESVSKINVLFEL